MLFRSDAAGLDRRAMGGPGDDGRVVGAVDGDRKGLIGRERPVGYGDHEIRGGRRNKRIDRVIVRNERIGAGRANDVKRAVGTSL